MDKELAKNESDWAFLYAEERKLRMKCQERIAAFMVDGPALAATSKQFIFALLDSGEVDDQLIRDMARVVQNSDDLAACININIFDPCWEITDKEREDINNARQYDELPRSLIQRFTKIFSESREQMSVHWHDLCHEHGIKCPHEIDAESKEEFHDLLQKLTAKM